LDHGLGDDHVDHFDMRARRDLGNHAAVFGMRRLRQHHVGDDLSGAVVVAPHHRSGALVARRLDAENQHAAASAPSFGLPFSSWPGLSRPSTSSKRLVRKTWMPGPSPGMTIRDRAFTIGYRHTLCIPMILLGQIVAAQDCEVSWRNR